jgi:hypothetical protein
MRFRINAQICASSAAGRAVLVIPGRMNKPVRHDRYVGAVETVDT